MLLAVSLLLLVCVSAVTGWFALRRRQELTRLPEAFRCRVRLLRGALPRGTRQWPGRAGRACWTHDVLLLRLGRFPAATLLLGVRFPEGPVEPAPPTELRGLGPDPVVLRLRLDDGTVVDLAAAADDRERLAGPFLAACVDSSSTATHRRPPQR